MTTFRRAIIFFGISLSVIALDQISKNHIVNNIGLNQGYSLISDYLDVVHVRNSGAAFGFFSGSRGSINRIILTLVSVAALIVIVGMAFWFSDGSMLSLVALAFFFGGASGNLIDRIIHGEVVDFIDVHVGTIHWPAFNVADTSLCIGAALFCVYIISQKKHIA